ncbi:hypothetical protein T484DRAFT_1793467, partial [Baffinella frigidus]
EKNDAVVQTDNAVPPPALKRVEIRGEGKVAPVVHGRWLLGSDTQGAIVGCHLRFSTEVDFFLPTLDVWGGPWSLDRCQVVSVNGTGIVCMEGGDLSVVSVNGTGIVCMEGGDLSLSRCQVGGGGEAAGEAASDCIVLLTGSKLSMAATEMSMAATEMSMAATEVRFAHPAIHADASIGAGGGVAATGTAKLEASECYFHHLSRGLALADESAAVIRGCIFTDLAVGAFK